MPHSLFYSLGRGDSPPFYAHKRSHAPLCSCRLHYGVITRERVRSPYLIVGSLRARLVFCTVKSPAPPQADTQPMNQNENKVLMHSQPCKTLWCGLSWPCGIFSGVGFHSLVRCSLVQAFMALWDALWRRLLQDSLVSLRGKTLHLSYKSTRLMPTAQLWLPRGLCSSSGPCLPRPRSAATLMLTAFTSHHQCQSRQTSSS